MPRSRLIHRVKAHAAKAVEGIVATETGSAAVAEALRRMQQGRDKAGEVVGALGLATRTDVERLSRKIGKLRKQLQAMLDDLEHRG